MLIDNNTSGFFTFLAIQFALKFNKDPESQNVLYNTQIEQHM